MKHSTLDALVPPAKSCNSGGLFDLATSKGDPKEEFWTFSPGVEEEPAAFAAEHVTYAAQ